MPKKTTPAERKAFIESMRVSERDYGSSRRLPVDMSFIDRKGNIVRPNKEDYQAAIKRRKKR